MQALARAGNLSTAVKRVQYRINDGESVEVLDILVQALASRGGQRLAGHS